jgi:uncharacterized protein YlzI (FlbEa/FlbD family)
MSPDTVLSMTTGQRITVLESAEEVVAKVIAFRRQLLHGPEIRSVEDESEN